MRGYLPVLLLATAAQAAIIRGSVVENQSSKPLARTNLRLEPIAGTPGGPRTARANTGGAFEFDSLPPGTYVLKATRQGFMPTEYGQKRWNSAGTPVVLAEDDAVTLSIRMLRYSAIRGTVGDENDVGLPDHGVIAYRNTSPPEIVSQAVTDDRGAFRLAGLEPGTYLVRTAGKRYPDETYLPTFSRETEKAEEARSIEVSAEQEAEFADVRPLAGGRFFTLTAGAATPITGTEVSLTLASELGRQTVKVAAFRFTDLPAGDYEVYAETRDGTAGPPLQAAYERVSLGRDSGVNLHLQPPPPPEMRAVGALTVTGGPSGNPGKLWIRRKDLAGVGVPYQAEFVHGRAVLPPGRWEVMLQPPSGYYVASFSRGGGNPPAGGRADGWNEVLSLGYAFFQFTVSSGPGAIRGTVKSGGDAVAGVPVYLEGYDTATHARITDLRTTRADARGQYAFGDLAPGTYRILGTFEYVAPDVQTMDLAGAQLVTVDPHGELALDLDLYVIR
ncbi:MAG TPA: carboxypeptidase-like regulatory domain-containing protein [Bryobacteraceae bacterium]|nr:carboxypeptidase-like regulatory domain-containing protein [Bryobacteraceae bacterium]